MRLSKSAISILLLALAHVPSFCPVFLPRLHLEMGCAVELGAEVNSGPQASGCFWSVIFFITAKQIQYLYISRWEGITDVVQEAFFRKLLHRQTFTFNLLATPVRSLSVTVWLSVPQSPCVRACGALSEHSWEMKFWVGARKRGLSHPGNALQVYTGTQTFPFPFPSSVARNDCRLNFLKP